MRRGTPGPSRLWTSVGFALLVGAGGCSEFRLDPIDPDGPPPVQVAVQDRFVQAPEAAVDVLFVVDATPSMTQELDNLGQSVSALLSELDAAQLDWQVGVVGANRESAHPGWLLGTPYVLTPAAADPVTAFSERLPAAGTSGEAGFAVAIEALDLARPGGPNAGFRRDDAVLQVVFVSDADDHSDAWLSDPVEDLLAALAAESDRSGLPARASALVGDVPHGCVSPAGAAQPGVRYAEVADRSGGRTGSICDIDFGALLADLGEDSVTLPNRFELSADPVPGTVSVDLDGEPTDLWGLDLGSAVPAVVFDTSPPAGARVVVRYVVREAAEVPTDVP
jgi:hypothetical protein